MDSVGESWDYCTVVRYVNYCITEPYSSASILGASDKSKMSYYYCKFIYDEEGDGLASVISSSTSNPRYLSYVR